MLTGGASVSGRRREGSKTRRNRGSSGLSSETADATGLRSLDPQGFSGSVFGARESVLLAALLAVAATVRALAWSRTAVLFNDGPVFLALAEAWGEGRFAEVIAHPYHPLYPVLISLGSAVVGDAETAAIAVAVGGGLLGVVAIFAFAWRAFGREVAWASAWLVTLHPWAVDFSSDVMSDSLYAGFYLTGFAALCSTLVRPSIGAAAICGVSAALAYLVRPEGIGLLLLALALFAWALWKDTRQRRPRLLAALAVLVVSIALGGPFWAAQQADADGYALTQKKSLRQLIAGGPSAEEIAQERQGRRRERARARNAGRLELPLPESAIRSDGRPEKRPPRSVVGAIEAVTRVARTSAAAFRYEVLAFAVFGLVLSRSNWRRDREGAVLGSIILYSAVLILLVWGAGYVGRRHALAAWLPAIPFAAVGWFGFFRALQARFFRKPSQANANAASRIATLALVVLLALVWGPRDLRPRRADRAPTRSAAEWLAETWPESGAVAAQKLRTAYYAKAPFVPLPSGHDGLLKQSLTQRRARWVVMDEAKLDDHLGLHEGVGDWLELRHVVSSDGQRVLVLEVTPKPAR